MDRFIAHDHLLERLKNQQVRSIIGYLNTEVLDDLMDDMERRLMRIKTRGPGARAFLSEALAGLQASVLKRMTKGFSGARDMLAKELRDIALAEARFSITILGREVPFDFTGKVPPASAFRRMVAAEPFNGHTLKDWFGGMAKSNAGEINRQVNIGLANGETTEQVMRRIRGTAAARFSNGTAGKIRRGVETITRSAVGAKSNGARRLAHEENGEVVKMERWVSVLDAATCPECAALDGQTWPVGDGPQPGFHLRCRCSRVPVLKSAKELGLKKGDLTPINRKAMDGKVPEKTTYHGWIKKQPAAAQKEFLGPTRYKLWKSGEVKLDKFVNDNRLLTLKELKVREGL